MNAFIAGIWTNQLLLYAKLEKRYDLTDREGRVMGEIIGRTNGFLPEGIDSIAVKTRKIKLARILNSAGTEEQHWRT
jgi:hypothetical protein